MAHWFRCMWSSARIDWIVPSWSSTIREDRSALINHTQAELGCATGIGARPIALRSLWLPSRWRHHLNGLKTPPIRRWYRTVLRGEGVALQGLLEYHRKCTLSVQDWFLVNDRLLNPTKSEVLAVGTATQRHTTISAGTVTVAGAHRCRSLTTSARSAYKSTRICCLIRKSMQFADRLNITCHRYDRSVTVCRPETVACALLIHVSTTVNRTFITSARRIFRSYRRYKTISHVMC